MKKIDQEELLERLDSYLNGLKGKEIYFNSGLPRH